MKNLIIILAVLLISISGTAQEVSKFCAFCKMPIHEDKFVSEISLSQEETIRFGSIECLVNYLTDKNLDDYKNITVTNYLNSKERLPAKNAIYLKSDRIHSPMGANIAAFSSKKEAQYFSKKDVQVYTWQELYQAFKTKNSGLGEASHHDHFRPDAFAPNGVMGDHLHPKGEWMLSARYMSMHMESLKKGRNKIATSTVYESYMAAPEKMNMGMLMLGIMYAPSSRLTLALMQGYIFNRMDMDALMTNDGMQMHKKFSTYAQGLGDIQLSVLYGIYSSNGKFLHLNFGLRFPTGDINKTDDTPMALDAKLPYAMQPGWGSFSTIAGFTYKEMYSTHSWGTQFLATFPVGENSEGYQWGNMYQLNLWTAYRFSTNLSFSGRVLGVSQNDINGNDPALNLRMSPTANPVNYGGEKVKIFGGMNVSFPVTSSMRSWRLAAEIGTPVYENYNGIQMNENISYSIGLKYLFI